MSESNRNINNEIDKILPSFAKLPPKQPILIAGPTASGKSALALALALRWGGVIVNADALQVYKNWRILTARPTCQELAQAPHALYGHIEKECAYSVGAWLKDVEPLLFSEKRPIIVGGTGLYFSALTKGLADIPDISSDVRRQAVTRLEAVGLASLAGELHADTAARIDLKNPARVLRAWEVETQTGRSMASWQDKPLAPALLKRDETACFLLSPEKAALNQRIASRFEKMIETGALDEVRANMDDLNDGKPASQAIGAHQLAAFLRGEISLAQAREKAIIATRQYAKRQRTWFRGQMSSWTKL